jgi:hypothetical protein
MTDRFGFASKFKNSDEFCQKSKDYCAYQHKEIFQKFKNA